MDPLRRHAVNVLTLFDNKGAQLKHIRDTYCKKYSVSGNDRQRLTAMTNEVIRWRGRLDYWLMGLLNKPNRKIQPELNNILRLGIYEVVMDEKVPDYAAVNAYVEIAKRSLGKGQGKLTNALLRKATGIHKTDKPEKCTLNDWYSFPNWLWEKWINQFGKEKTIELANLYNSAPKIDIRRNEAKLSHDDLQSYCNDHDVEIEPWSDSNIFYKVMRNLSGFRNLIVAGKISVQDRAAGMVVELLAPIQGETILDVCAAPGTKAIYIAELMDGKGELYISDNNTDRLGKLETNFKNSVIDVKDASKDNFPMADAILIDAPCSGTGVIGKKPDIRWRRSMSNIQEFVELQKSIINHMSQFLKPGGRMVYSTCSIEPEENWGVVDAFLKLKGNYFIDMETNDVSDSWLDERGALIPFPPKSNTDGMFAVRLNNEIE
jgi:16S rRNA (cytosine967-C5)-methyltransferase